MECRETLERNNEKESNNNFIEETETKKVSKDEITNNYNTLIEKR